MSDRYIDKEIRAKSLDTGEWVYGGYIRCENEHYIVKSESVCIEPDVNHYENVIVNILVDRKTLGQSTTYRDKNKKIAFEGDFYMTPGGPQIYQIRFISGCFMGGRSKKEAEPLFWTIDGGDESRWFRERVRIIGNIYENPELLKDPGQ